MGQQNNYAAIALLVVAAYFILLYLINKATKK